MTKENESLIQVEKIIPLLQAGGIGVVPTDTLYGLVGSALQPLAVEKIYAVRQRELNKPLIVLISSLEDLKLFEISLSEKQQEVLRKVWPGKVSVVLDCEQEKFAYLHRATKAIAFRLPSAGMITQILQKTGPLVAPSANLAGEKPATTIAEAKAYFGDQLDFYLDEGELISEPSTLVAFNEKEELTVLRKGAAQLP